MTSGQKVIKYIAIAFAIFLSVNIIGSIIFGIVMLGTAVGFSKGIIENSQYVEDEMRVISNDVKEIKSLELNIGASTLDIKKGDKFKVETNNTKVTYEEKDGKVVVKEETQGLAFNLKNTSAVVVYLPEKSEFIEEVNIQTGAGVVTIDGISANKFNMDLGAGSSTISNVIVENNAKISTGAGRTEITSSSLKNTTFELGVGEFKYEGTLKGEGTLNAGVGSISLQLRDGVENYTFEVEKGMGEIKIGGTEVSDGSKIGNGKSYLKVNGGIGRIKID